MSIETINGEPTYSGPKVTFNKGYFSAEGLPWSTKDEFSGAESAFFNYWQQQQQNAYELELWNLNNKYNTPAAQMGRYQDAGLNPNLIYGQSNTTSGPASTSSPIAAKPTNFKVQNTLAALGQTNQLIGQVLGVMRGVKDIYDYATYGSAEHGLDVQNAIIQNDALAASTRFKKFFEMPLAVSKATGHPVSVVTPEGAEFTIDYNDTLEAQSVIAGINNRNMDTSVKDWLKTNYYPFKAKEASTNSQALEYDYKMKKHTLDVYDSIVNSLGIESPFVKALLWKMLTAGGELNMSDAISLGKLMF